MKIKQVCEATQLTERTIRYYVELGLIDPAVEYRNGREYREYSNQDMEHLQAIAVLRKMQFSISDIQEMKHEPSKIAELVAKHKQELQAELEIRQKILHVCEHVDFTLVEDVYKLAAQFAVESEGLGLPASDIEPNFGRFDAETKEEKEHAYFRFRVKQVIQGKLERIWRPIGRVLTVLIVLAFMMAGLIGISAIPKKISLDVPAVEYRTENYTYVEHTRIRVEGKLYKRWFSDPKFSGKILIDKYPYTKEYDTIDVTFYKEIMNGWGGLTYAGITSDHKPTLETLGGIRMRNDLQQISIEVYEPIEGDGKTKKDLVLSAPANTREEAFMITEQVNQPRD